MLRFINLSDYVGFLLSAYLLFMCTILTNGWHFLVGNSSLGFRAGCILSAMLSGLAIVRVFGGRFPSNTGSKAIIVSLTLLLLGAILFWVKMASG
jgi:hypothetical protein